MENNYINLYIFQETKVFYLLIFFFKKNDKVKSILVSLKMVKSFANINILPFYILIILSCFTDRMIAKSFIKRIFGTASLENEVNVDVIAHLCKDPTLICVCF